MPSDMSRIFTKGYVVYLLGVVLVLGGAGWWVNRRMHPLTIEDMARADYKDDGQSLIRKIDQDGVLHDLRPNTHKDHQGVQYATNGDGMRDDHEYALEKTPGRRRLMFVGDSFTFGWGLELEYTFVKQVERLLGPGQWEVLNLGVPGFTTIDEVTHFKQKGLKYHPDVVFLMYHFNDTLSGGDTPLGDSPQTLKTLVDYYKGDGTPEERARVETYLRAHGWPLDPPWNPKGMSWRNLSYVVTNYLPLYADRTEQALAGLEALAAAYHFRVIVGIIPEIDQEWATYPFDDLHQRVRAQMERHHFRVVDLKPILQRFPNKELMLWGTNGHTSAYANRIIAQVLVAELTGRN